MPAVYAVADSDRGRSTRARVQHPRGSDGAAAGVSTTQVGQVSRLIGHGAMATAQATTPAS